MPIESTIMRFLKKLIISTFLLFTHLTYAQDGGGIVDDAFDPFADYSDFVEASTEEADINFFKFGRSLSVGATLGLRTFTGEQANLYSSGNHFGGFFTYYLSIQFATQLSYTTGTSDLGFNVPEAGSNSQFSGSARFNTFSLHGKYFINTQNLTKAVSKFNPYIIGGFSQIERETSDLNQSIVSAKDSTGSFDIGVGGEYIFNNNKNFISFQAVYYKADFANENREIRVPDQTDTLIDSGIKPAGDILTFSIMIGFNY